MKKRILMILVLLILAASFIYAEHNVVFATVSPYALQIGNSDWDTSFSSKYGWGAKAGYRVMGGPILLGVDLTYQGYVYPTTDYALTSARFLVKLGGEIALSNSVDLDVDAGAGVEMDYFKTTINFLPVVAGSISVSKDVKPNMAVVVGTDVSVTWPQSRETSYVATVWDFNINCGLKYEF